MKRVFAGFVLVCSLLATLFASAPMRSAQAQPPTQKQAMPAGLQQAFLAATSKSFSIQRGTYTTEYNGMGYKLNVAGLQVEGNGIQWGISLRGLGRGNQADDVSAPEIVQTEERLEYRRGNLIEWYRDTSLGVEQGFTINESPKGNGRLVLHLDLSTNVEGKLNDDERGMSFAGTDGQTLRYDNLKVYDANGAELYAKMVYNPAQVVIQIDDHDAVYPITIDPLIFLEQKVIAIDGAADDNFSYSVALSGNTALIGASYDTVGANAGQGSVYVFTRSGAIWTQQAKLTASDGMKYDGFGSSVALSGDTALVGATGDTVGANADQGSAYVFVRSGTTWTQQAKLTAADGAIDDQFGGSVALSGNTALVGVVHDTVGANVNQGSAYVFVRSSSTWNQQQKLTAADGAANDQFGYSVALSGGTALVGAFGDDVGANVDQGSAYIFIRSGTTWTLQQQLNGFNTGYSFGASVALSGNDAVIGSPQANEFNAGEGRVDFYHRSGTTWNWGGCAYGGNVSVLLGTSVALSGNTALAALSTGNVRAYVRIAGVWQTSSPLQISASDGESFAGSSVAISGDTALVGARWHDVGANHDQGTAYFFQAYRTNDLAVSAATGSGTVLYPGETLYLTAAVTNYGSTTESNVLLNVSLPAGLTRTSHIATQGTYSPSHKSWFVGTLPPGVTATLTIAATVNQITTATRKLIFSALNPYRDTNAANNSASLTLTVKKKERALNGGFNTYTGTSRIPTSWVKNANFSATDGKDTTAANRKEGLASVKISNTTAKVKTLTQTLPTLSGAAGDPFIFSYWVKGSTLPAAGLCQGQVLFYNSATLKSTKTLPCGSTGTFAYVKKTLSFTVPAAYTKVIIKFTYSKASSTVWFDWASLLR